MLSTLDQSTPIFACPTLELRSIGSENYLFRSRDRMGWSADVCHQKLFWELWSNFSTPKPISTAFASCTTFEPREIAQAIDGLLECGILELEPSRDGYNRLLDGPIARDQVQSLCYHLSSARPDWVNYSDAQDLKERDLDEMDSYVRENDPPSNYKLTTNSSPAYDLTPVLPANAFGGLSDASVVFGHGLQLVRNQISLDALNFILNFTFSKTGTVDMYATGAHLRKAVPSGGARHPIEAYVGIGEGVDGIDKGVYHYNVRHHRLDRLDMKLGDVDKFIRGASPLARCCMKPVSAVIVHTCIFARSMFRYREARSYRVMHFDLGHIHANEIMASRLIGIDCNESYSVPEALIESLLRIDPLQESAMSSFIVY